MEVDESRVANSKADNRLEKPFDTDTLRGLVHQHVKKSTTNPVSSFVAFPDMPEFEETPAESSSADAGVVDDVFSIPEESTNGHMQLNSPVDEIEEEFAAVPLTATPKSPDESDEGGWAHQDLTKFKIQIPDNDNSDFASKFVIPQDDDLDNAHVEVAGDFEEISFHENAPDLTENLVKKVHKSVTTKMMESLQNTPSKSANFNAQPNTSANSPPHSQSKMDMSANMMEKIVRDEAREVIESVCWKILPEIAERIVREEINKILRETEKSI